MKEEEEEEEVEVKGRGEGRGGGRGGGEGGGGGGVKGRGEGGGRTTKKEHLKSCMSSDSNKVSLSPEIDFNLYHAISSNRRPCKPDLALD